MFPDPARWTGCNAPGDASYRRSTFSIPIPSDPAGRVYLMRNPLGGGWRSPESPGANRVTFERELAGAFGTLFASALRLTGKREDAEDLLQDAVVRAYRAWARFEKGTNFRAWMSTILTNLYISEYRRRQRRGDEFSLDTVDTDLWRDGGSDAPGPEEVVIGAVFDEDIQTALDSLPEAIRLVMILTEVNEMSYAEVAEVLGIPVGTVRSRLFRGREMMRSRLAGVAGERGWSSHA